MLKPLRHDSLARAVVRRAVPAAFRLQKRWHWRKWVHRPENPQPQESQASSQRLRPFQFRHRNAALAPPAPAPTPGTWKSILREAGIPPAAQTAGVCLIPVDEEP